MTKAEQLQLRVSRAQKKEIRRRADASGMDMSSYVLAQVLPPESERFDRLVNALAHPRKDSRFVFAEINALLANAEGDAFVRAVSNQPRTLLDPFKANYLAAMIEAAAGQKGVRPPQWTQDIAPLKEPYWGNKLASLRLHLLLNAPLPFRSRNIFIDATVGDQL